MNRVTLEVECLDVSEDESSDEDEDAQQVLHEHKMKDEEEEELEVFKPVLTEPVSVSAVETTEQVVSEGWHLICKFDRVTYVLIFLSFAHRY